MRRLPSISPRSGRLLIALLLAIKLVLGVWNAVVFDGRTPDADYHAERAASGGLATNSLTHDPPGYYLPALAVHRPDDVTELQRARSGEEGELRDATNEPAPRPSRAQKEFRDELLDFLRHTNVVWLSVFYLVWIYWIFPRVLPGFEAWFLASLLLLALPGYQRLGVLAHPDNLFVGAASVAIGAWLFVRARWERDRSVRFGHLALWALAIGVLAATRTFAIVPAVVLSVVLVVYAVRSAQGRPARAVARALALLTVVAVLGAPWYIKLRRSAHEPGREHAVSFLPQFEQDRSGFNPARYYTSFRVGPLLRDDGRASDAPSLDSFLTLLYSDTWGDQWRIFASPRSKPDKEWAIRALLGAALPVLPVSAAFGVAALVAFVERARQLLAERRGASAWERAAALLGAHEAGLVLAAIAGLGLALFVYWQGTAALLPGDNSTVRFNYVASLCPAAIALVMGRAPTPLAFSLASAYFLLLNVVAFPLTMYWPR